MRHALPIAHPVPLLHALRAMRDLEHPRARDVVVAVLHVRHDLEEVGGAEALRGVHAEETGLEVLGGEVAEGTAVGVLGSGGLAHEDLLTAAARRTVWI